jgi:hypothetical protein
LTPNPRVHRRAEDSFEHAQSRAAIRRLAKFSFDFDNGNPEFVRPVAIENIHRGPAKRTGTITSS